MRWIDLQHNLDPNYRIQSEKIYTQRAIAQAHLEQAERHQNERTRIENMRIQAQTENAQEQSRAVVERERIAGKNALALADRNHILGQLQQGSQLIDSMIHSQLKQEEDWNATFADTMRQLFVTEADTIRQTKLKELDHKHQIQKMTLEFNLKTLEMYIQNEIQNTRVSFDKACELIFRLVERSVGLGDEMMKPSDVSDWVREAMAQVG